MAENNNNIETVPHTICKTPSLLIHPPIPLIPRLKPRTPQRNRIHQPTENTSSHLQNNTIILLYEKLNAIVYASLI